MIEVSQFKNVDEEKTPIAHLRLIVTGQCFGSDPLGDLST